MENETTKHESTEREIISTYDSGVDIDYSAIGELSLTSVQDDTDDRKG